MGQARNRGTREQRVAEAIARNAEADKAAAERSETEKKQRQINTLAKSIAMGIYAAGHKPEPEVS